MIADYQLLYLEHLTVADRRLIADAVGGGRDLLAALGEPAVEQAVFGPGGGDERFVMISPFLVFAAAVHRTAVHLSSASYVDEWTGPRRRIPVFDVAPLRELLAGELRRYFFVELLASYTHVASGVTWQRTARGWRRHRFSELDPVRLAGLLEAVGPGERPGIYRRLGDLALFLTGVFPDHAALTHLAERDASRLLRLSALPPDRSEGLSGLALFELLGARWYQAATASSPGTPTGTLAAAGEIGRRFTDARRVLNTVTDRYLFPWRERWFGRP